MTAILRCPACGAVLPVGQVPETRCEPCILSGAYPPAWLEAWHRSLKIQQRLEDTV